MIIIIITRNIAEARMADAKGRLLAHATTTCLVFEIPWETSKGT